METQTNKSARIIDHRAVATHGGTGILGILVGIFASVRSVPAPAAQDADLDLVGITSTALDRGVDFWAAHLEPSVWRAPHVVLIDRDEKTACGVAGQASGPFYCPPSERIYLDLSFLRAIPGDLARAYVVAHELGHHVQKLRNEFAGRDSVAVELQADCYAGMWMRSERDGGHLAEGDIDAAIAEAERVGDDRINPGSAPETWTHGSAEQRAAKVREGLGGSACR